MKTFLLILASISLGAAAHASTQVDVKDVVGPNNSFHDPVIGVALTYPAGWQVVAGMRWGANDSENTFMLKPIWPSEARPSLYYQPFTAAFPYPTDARARFLEGAKSKEASRQDRMKDYHNLPETFQFKTIAGKPAFTYEARFGDDKMAEYFVRIIGPSYYVMFFTTGRVDDVAAIRPDIDRMAETIQIP